MTARIAALALSLPLCIMAAPASANCGGGPFNGFYIGGHLGYGSLDTKFSSPDAPTIKDDDGAFNFGAQWGYNLQCGQVVLGLEGDISHIGLETKGVWPDPGVGDTNLTDSIDWFSTIRGRLGMLVSPDTLIYATGGVAFADIEHKLSTPGLGFSQTDSEWRSGWTIGGGIEFLRHNNWLLRAEALYVDLGKETRTYTINGGGCVGTCTGTASWDDSFWVGRLGVSYKFGDEPRGHTPLK